MHNQSRSARHRTPQTATRRRIAAGLATVGVCTLVATTAATPAAAFPGFTLTTGGGVATTAQIPYQATARSNLIINDITAPTTTFTCPTGTGSNASTVSGNVNRGMSTSNLVGTIRATKFGTATLNGSMISEGSNPCLGSSQRLAFQQVGTWAIAAAGATKNGSTPVSVYNIKLKAYIGTCSYDLAGSTGTSGGSVSGTFTNGVSTSALEISASAPTTLVVSNTSVSGGCFGGGIKNGDRFTLGGTFSVAVGQGSSALDPIGLTS